MPSESIISCTNIFFYYKNSSLSEAVWVPQEDYAEVQENMTLYYNASSSLKTWSANSEAGSRALAPVFGNIFGEGQGSINTNKDKKNCNKITFRTAARDKVAIKMK